MGSGAKHAVGEWIATHTQVLEVLDAGDDVEAYRVLHGDAVPRELVLYRYRVTLPISEAVMRTATQDGGLHELRIVGDLGDAVLEVYGNADAVAAFDAAFRR
jgi:hypothetical protein